MLIGVGYDSHRFEPGRPLVLGGVELEEGPGLAGPFDGDAVAHAVIDALLGAAGLGDIEDRFVDADPDYRGASSLELLTEAVRAAEGENYQVVNVDLTVVAETPAIGRHRDLMRDRLADRLHVAPVRVSVKATGNGGMGWIGRGEGVASVAVALLDRVASVDQVHAALRTGG